MCDTVRHLQVHQSTMTSDNFVPPIRIVKLPNDEREVKTGVRIDEFPDYFIYDDGNVYSYKRKKFLKPSDNGHGYYIVDLCNNGRRKSVRIHRLVALHFVANPENLPCVDHIDRNKKNNNYTNLRWCTNAQNRMNQLKYSNNTTGITGVYYDERRKKYHARIKVNGKFIHLGYFDTLEDAAIKRFAAEIVYFGKFAPNRNE